MKKNINLINQKFGKLYILNFGPSGDKWFCKCDCGNEAIISGSSLRSGNTLSCGCLKRQHLSHIHQLEFNKKQEHRILGRTRKQRPLRSVMEEIFDHDLDYEKREELMEAYDEFWLNLDDKELVRNLKMLLI